MLFIENGWVLFIISFCSLVSCITITAIYFKYRISQNLGFDLILGLSISDLGLSISLIVCVLIYNLNGRQAIEFPSNRCMFCGLFQLFFQISSFSWSFLINFITYNTFIQKRILSRKKILIFSLIISVILPALFSFLPTIFQVYQPYQPFPRFECTIYTQTGVGMACLIVYILYFLGTIFYGFYTIYQSQKYFRNSQPTFYQQLALKLLKISPLNIFISYFPEVILKILLLMTNIEISSDYMEFGLYMISLSGFINSFFYGYLLFFHTTHRFSLAFSQIENSSISQNFFLDNESVAQTMSTENSSNQFQNNSNATIKQFYNNSDVPNQDKQKGGGVPHIKQFNNSIQESNSQQNTLGSIPSQSNKTDPLKQ